MPSFFDFQTGDSSRAPTDSSPLLGRFRAVPGASSRQLNKKASFLGALDGRRRSIGRGLRAWGSLGNLRGGEGDDEDGEEDIIALTWRRWMADLWISPTASAVKGAVDRWWSRWVVLWFMPAALAVAWCAIPFPIYELPDDDLDMSGYSARVLGHKVPGHGEARVQINFWFFLFVYYGFYNVTALMWITKVFNIYSLNWWPQTLGFPFTVSVIAIFSIAVPIPIYLIPETRFITNHNTTWICWTFVTMAMPLLIALGILLNHERHLGLRQSLSETQRIFTSSWWTGDADTLGARERPRRPLVQPETFDPNAPLEVALASDNRQIRERALALRKRWLPASFVRFIWFCMALFIGMLAYVLGETYAEIYLRTLPHNTFETIAYVYSWVITVHLLDGLTGWILGGNEGERVGSYPLGWIFKLYFSLTYLTYVRALYARLRSYQQFILLQVLSSTFLIILAPLTISRPFHWLLTLLSINNQPLPSYQKFCARNIFLRNIAENVSMLAFLGSILVLHYGANKDVYPYFAFDRSDMATFLSSPLQRLLTTTNNSSTITTINNTPPTTSPNLIPDPPPFGSEDEYTFGRTFYASIVTWACEIVASWIVRRILWLGWKVDVVGEGRADLVRWPELLPTGVVVMVHVLQNMFFSIVRLRFP